MQKTFYRMQKKEIKKIIRFRVAYKLKTYFLVYSIVFVAMLIVMFAVTAQEEDATISAIILSALILTLFFTTLYMFPESLVKTIYFRFRVMDYVRIIDDDEFLFAYTQYNQNEEIFVRRDEVLQIDFTNSVDDASCFDYSCPSVEENKRLRNVSVYFHPGCAAKKMNLELVKFVKPKKDGYFEEITEYIIPEFFDEQEELVEALHVLADNFEKRKYPEKNEQTPT